MPASSWFVPIEYDDPGGMAVGRPIWFVDDPAEVPPPEPTTPTTGQIWPRGQGWTTAVGTSTPEPPGYGVPGRGWAVEATLVADDVDVT